MDQAIDRRSARTRRMLHDALFALILRKGYEAITVQDLIDEADIGRSTFYAHFAGKEELLRSGFQLLRGELKALQEDAIAQPPEAGRPVLSFSTALFEHACAHKHIYRALVGGRGATVVFDELQRVLTELVRRDLASAPLPAPIELTVQFVVSTFHTVLRWGLARGAGDPGAMNAAFREFALRGIGDIAGRSEDGR
jgi:AcrR family transcriptional regulator